MLSSSLKRGTITETAGEFAASVITGVCDSFGKETPAMCAALCRSAALQWFQLAPLIERQLGYCEARVLFPLLDGGPIASNEGIDAVLLGINFTLRLRCAWFPFHKFIVARPEGELVHHVLRFGDVNGRMTRTLQSFVAQIK